MSRPYFPDANAILLLSSPGVQTLSNHQDLTLSSEQKLSAKNLLATFDPLVEETLEEQGPNDPNLAKTKVLQSNVDDITESMIFTLGSPRDMPATVRTGRNTAMAPSNTEVHHVKRQKWERYTFTGLDKLAPKNSYTIPVNPKLYAGVEERRIPLNPDQAEKFCQKSAIMQLLEVNGKLPKASDLEKHERAYEERRAFSNLS